MNLLARDPDNVKFICYNECYARYLKRDGALDSVVRVGSERPREFTREYINEFIRTARENGYLVTYNHPYWSMEDEADILSYDGIFSLEICNYSSYVLNYLETCAPLYDKMLLAGKRVFCHGSDDNHNKHPEGSPYCDSFGAYTVIMPEEFTYDTVIKAMETGEMYSSMGPLFHKVSMVENKIHIECTEAVQITVFTGSKAPLRAYAPVGSTITSADFEVDDRAKYVRVSVMDEAGRFADTRGFMRDELEF